MEAAKETDTIAAISTLAGEAGIGIVRLSGPVAVGITDVVFSKKGGTTLAAAATHTVHYGWIRDSAGSADEVLVTLMRAPRSYTREDVVEIGCHGGVSALRRVLEVFLQSGARLAEPGEFTRRAFLNGRIDLTQAEAVLDIIKAKTDVSLRAGLEHLQGRFSGMINELRDQLVGILSHIEAQIDFNEDDIGALDREDIKSRLNKAGDALGRLIDDGRYGRFLREGAAVVICGRPNVGKSSLLNALLKHDRSIVTPIAGTTRDTVEEMVNIRGVPVRLIDTAGMLQPSGMIERKAVQRSFRAIEHADLVLMVFDGSKALTPADAALARRVAGKPVLAVINKSDLRQCVQREKITKWFGSPVEVSAKRERNIGHLEGVIVERVYGSRLTGPVSLFMANMRHTQKLKEALRAVGHAVRSSEKQLSWEFPADDIRQALMSLDDITGARFSGDILDRIFAEFCVGK